MSPVDETVGTENPAEQANPQQTNSEQAYTQQQAYAQQQQAYAQQGGYQAPFRPVGQLPTNRSLLKIILLSIITLGIYSIVYYSNVSNDINAIAGRYDGKKTMHYCLLFFLVGPITLGIGYLVWNHKLAARVGTELRRRNLTYSFDVSSFWLFGILLSFVLVGPFIYAHMLATAMNKLSESYNVYG